MNKRKGILQELVNKVPNKALIKSLLQELYSYFESYDLDCGTNHHIIFKAIFFEHKKYEWIIRELFISRNTLPRYIERYNAFAKKLIACKEKYAMLTKDNFIV